MFKYSSFAFGEGFKSSKLPSVNPHLYDVDVRNGMPIVSEKKYQVKNIKLNGKNIKYKSGKLSDDLGKPAMKATEKELKNYVDNAPNKSEKKSRVARVNLMKSFKKGLKSQEKN